MRNILEARKKVDLTIPEILRFIINQCTKSTQRPTHDLETKKRRTLVQELSHLKNSGAPSNL